MTAPAYPRAAGPAAQFRRPAAGPRGRQPRDRHHRRAATMSLPLASAQVEEQEKDVRRPETADTEQEYQRQHTDRPPVPGRGDEAREPNPNLPQPPHQPEPGEG